MTVGARVTWRGRQVNDRARGGALEGVTDGAEHLLQVSRTLVPLEEGTLERSGRTDVEDDAGEIAAAVSYDTVYARRQHEELTWRHDNGRQAKYLEQPCHTEAEQINELIAAALRRALT